jgi:hypothetical protein
MAIFKEVVNKTKSSYIILLFLQYVGGNLSECILGKNKLKLFCLVATYSTRCRTVHKTAMIVIVHCHTWTFSAKGNRKTKYFYLTERSILLLTISALNTDCYIHQHY